MSKKVIHLKQSIEENTNKKNKKTLTKEKTKKTDILSI